jgi:hypothetical protein
MFGFKVCDMAKFFFYQTKYLEFHANFESVESVSKYAPKKSYKQTKLTNMSQSGKSADFRHVYVKGNLNDQEGGGGEWYQ